MEIIILGAHCRHKQTEAKEGRVTCERAQSCSKIRQNLNTIWLQSVFLTCSVASPSLQFIFYERASRHIADDAYYLRNWGTKTEHTLRKFGVVECAASWVIRETYIVCRFWGRIVKGQNKGLESSKQRADVEQTNARPIFQDGSNWTEGREGACRGQWSLRQERRMEPGCRKSSFKVKETTAELLASKDILGCALCLAHMCITNFRVR